MINNIVKLFICYKTAYSVFINSFKNTYREYKKIEDIARLRD